MGFDFVQTPTGGHQKPVKEMGLKLRWTLEICERDGTESTIEVDGFLLSCSTILTSGVPELSWSASYSGQFQLSLDASSMGQLLPV